MRLDGGGGRAAARIRVDAGLVPGGSDRLKRQVEFLLEVDRLKTVLRQTILTDRSRQEQDPHRRDGGFGRAGRLSGCLARGIHGGSLR